MNGNHKKQSFAGIVIKQGLTTLTKKKSRLKLAYGKIVEKKPPAAPEKQTPETSLLPQFPDLWIC